MERLFTNTTSSSNKFWAVNQIGPGSCEVRWGRIGTSGQKQTKTFSSTHSMTLFIDRKISEKLSEGYVAVSTEDLQKEVQTARELGTQFKISRMEFITSAVSNGLVFGNEYFPDNGVFVEIMNSWSKEVTHLFLSRKDAFELVGVKFNADGCTFAKQTTHTDHSWVAAIRKRLKDIAEAIVKITTQTFGNVHRALAIDDDEDKTIMATIIDQAHKMPGSAQLGDQLIMKFATLGARTLEI